MDTLEEMKMQVAQLNMWTKAYDEGHPMVTDREWDKHYFDLVQFEKKTGIYLPNSPTQKIDYQVVSKLNKVTHSHPMLSLDKTKDWNEFTHYFSNLNVSKDVIGMVKLDGLTCSLRYIGGMLISAETRGNGEIGEDILHNALTLHSIPKKINYKDELVVDGEIICTYKDFEPFANEYKNPRNFAAGSIRLLDARECANRNLTFVVWNVIKGYDEVNSFMQRLIQIENLGFTVTPYTSSFDYDAKEYLINQAKEYGYPIDGLVGRFDDIEYGKSLGSTGHHSRAAFAFKFYDEEYETTLKDIEFSLGRTGVLTPVAIYEDVDSGDSILTRASLHNLSVMNETLGIHPYVGQKIKVAKMNEIIPQITWAEKNPPEDAEYIHVTECPVCGGSLEVKDNDGVLTIWCANPNCEGKFINILDHFAGTKGLDIKGLSKATLEKLIDWGWVKEVADLYSLRKHEKEWINKPGFGVKSVDNILTAIDKSREPELWRFISSLGIPLIGSTVAKELAKTFKTWEDFINAVDSEYKFYSLPNFGIEMHNAIHNFSYITADKLASFMDIKPYEQKESAASLNGITVVITGKTNVYKNRDSLKADIEAHGGKVTGSVTSKTQYLINNDVTSTSAKNKTAISLGVPIISENDFIKKFF